MANREERAIGQLNAAAGLPAGFDDSGRRRGISLGYIGNCSMNPNGYDDRAWGFFRPHSDPAQRMMGRYPTHDEALDAFDGNRPGYLKWAQGAEA